MGTFWTLISGGVEKSFQDWGFTDPRMRLVSQAQSTFTVRIPGASNLVAAPPIPFEAAVTIWRNRSLSGGTYGGGSIVFQGRQVTRRSAANSDAPGDTLVFGDAWYDFENLVFQQQWNYGSAPNTTYFSRLNLFQRYDIVVGISAATNGSSVINLTLAAAMTLSTGDYVSILNVPGITTPLQCTVIDPTHITVPGQLSGTYSGGGQLWPDNRRITNGAQMQEIINYANSCGVAIQAGTIDLAYILPIYPVRGVSCASALQICLKPQPDAVTWIDYTTTPPTFNCRARANLTAATLAYSDNGATHKASEITPRPDLQVPDVVIQYQKTVTSGSETDTDFGTDAYPALSTGRSIRSLVLPIDLRGATVQTLSVVVEANALPNFTSSAMADILASIQWWRNKKNEMINYQNLAMVPGTFSVLADGAHPGDPKINITSTWLANTPNEYSKGEILDWMGVTVVQATISAQFSYYELDASGSRTWHSVLSHTISVRVKLTNSPVGRKPYNAIASADPGESAPAGLAQNIYNSLQALQYEGTHSIVDPGINTTSALVGPKNALCLSGGAAAWLTMNATIQLVDFDFYLGRADIGFGPAKHIAPGDLEELLQFWRFRLVYDNPNLRISGKQSQTQGSEVGGDTASENTTGGNPIPSILAIQSPLTGSNIACIKHDAANQSLAIGKFDSAFAQLASTSSAILRTADLEDDGTKRNATFQWLSWKDDSCNKWKAKVFMTPPEPA